MTAGGCSAAYGVLPDYAKSDLGARLGPMQSEMAGFSASVTANARANGIHGKGSRYYPIHHLIMLSRARPDTLWTVWKASGRRGSK